MTNTHIALFEDKKIRKIWFQDQWYFSVVDVVCVLTGSDRPRKYWNDLKTKLKTEGSEVSEQIGQLKMVAEDGKLRTTDCSNTEIIFRIIQSIPSPKAEPFKQWLAKVGYERIKEIENPELAQERMKLLYEKKGYPKQWIDKRLRGIAVRQELTDEWEKRGAQSEIDYAILTNEITHATFGMTVKEYKQYKGLAKQNLRDHMTDLELILTMLGEATTTKFHKDRNSKKINELKKDAKAGGSVAGRTRKDIEKQGGNKIISEDNYLDLSKNKLE